MVTNFLIGKPEKKRPVIEAKESGLEHKQGEIFKDYPEYLFFNTPVPSHSEIARAKQLAELSELEEKENKDGVKSDDHKEGCVLM